VTHYSIRSYLLGNWY